MTINKRFYRDDAQWLISEDLSTLDEAGLSDCLFAQGNGFIGVKGGLEEGWSEADRRSADGIFLNGQYVQESISHVDGAPGTEKLFEQLLAVPNVKKIQVDIGKQQKVVSHERQLDCQTGLVNRQKVVELPDKKQCLIEYERFVSAANPHLICIKIECLALSDNVMVTIQPELDDGYIIDSPLSEITGKTYRAKHLLELQFAEQHEEFARFIHRVKNSATKLATTCIDMVHAPSHSTGKSHQGLVPQAIYINTPKYVRLPVGKSVVFYRYALFHVHDNISALKQWSQSAANSLLDATYSSLKKQHCDAMQKFWLGASQTVALSEPHSGLTQQQGLHFGLLHLIQAAGSVQSAGMLVDGLDSVQADGHLSWQVDIHCIPCLALCAPARARQILVTRYEQLAHARAKAMELGFTNGALYACSTISGEECAMNTLSASTQLHINGAVAYGIQHYFRATGDVAFLCHYGAEMLVETARLWAQSGYFDAQNHESFRIENVSGLVEQGGLLNRHLYTYLLAKMHFLFALEIMDLLRNVEPRAYAKLKFALRIDDDELQHWQRISQSIELTDLTPQPGTTASFDDVLAMMLADELCDASQKQQTLDNYLAAMQHDQALSYLVCCRVLCEVGRVNEAKPFFGRSARWDLDQLRPENRQGLHYFAMASTYNAIVYGFLGVRLRKGGLSVCPKLPSGWQQVTQHLHFHGRIIAFSVSDTEVDATLLMGEPITIFVYDSTLHLQPNRHAVTATQRVMERF